MSNNQMDFDKAAAGWDAKPRRLKLAEDVFRAIAADVSLNPEMDVLDFGCGTGLLTLLLQPLVGRITGADTSKSMLDALHEKVRGRGISNVSTLFLEQEQHEPMPGAYDLIVSNMTLHHIPDVPTQLLRLSQALKPGGYLCLADLDPDEGQFHGESGGAYHDGFERSWLREQLETEGLVVLSQRTAATMRKTARNGEARDFTIFLTTARKPLS